MPGLHNLLVLILNLKTITFASESVYTFHADVITCDMSALGSITNHILINTERVLDCVYRCSTDTNCTNLIFKRTSQQCLMLSKNHQLKHAPGSAFLCVGLEHVRDKGKDKVRFWVITGRMSHQGAERRCKRDSGRLVKIDNQEKQEMVEAVAKQSGHEYLAIGLYTSKGVWYYSDHTKVTYENWTGDVRSGLTAVMSKTDHYRWIAVFGGSEAAICELV